MQKDLSNSSHSESFLVIMVMDFDIKFIQMNFGPLIYQGCHCC